jgi:lipopolysaccharide transport system ATP-binding protein
MEEVSAKEGRTVLFVSHNMGAISDLCTSALVLDKGQTSYIGTVVDAITRYGGKFSEHMLERKDLRDWLPRTGSGMARIVWAELTWQRRIGSAIEGCCPALGDTLVITFQVEKKSQLDPEDMRLSVAVRTVTGGRVLHVSNEDALFSFPRRERAVIEVRLPDLKLYPGFYTVSLWIGSSKYNDYDYIQDCIGLEVVQGDLLHRNFKTDWSQGVVYHESEWCALE